MEDTTQQPSTVQPSSEIQPIDTGLTKKHKLLFILGACIFILIGGVGGILFGKSLYAPTNQQSESALPTRIPTTLIPTSSAPTDSTPTAIQGWKTYQNQKYGYSVSYPEDWFELGEDPNGGKNFSNKNVGAPLEMGINGIWFSITVVNGDKEIAQIFSCNLSQPCIAKKGMAQDGGEVNVGIAKVADLTINGYPAVKYIEWQSPLNSTSFKDHFFDNLAFSVKKNNTYFTLKTLSLDKDTANRYSGTIEQIAKSLKI